MAAALVVRADRVKWSEVASFFAQPPAAQVYVVGQNDEGKSVVTFGDGVNGSRLPTGQDNVLASYRFGAGAASPPAGSIKQVVQPRRGCRAWSTGGRRRRADAERAGSDPEPGSALGLPLGRAVSIQDMEAAAPECRESSPRWRNGDGREGASVRW